MISNSRYIEAGLSADEQSVLAHSNHISRHRGKQVAPWLCVLALVAVGFGGFSLTQHDPRSVRIDATLGRSDISTASIRMTIDLLGLQYSSLSSVAGGDQQLLREALQRSITTKARLDPATTFVWSDIGSTASRSTLTVTFRVPDQVAAEALRSRLSEGSLLKLMKTNVHAIATATVPAPPFRYTDVSMGSPQIEQDKALVTESDGSEPVVPTVVIELELKGLNYQQLALAGADLRNSVAQAVQKGVAAEVSSLDSSTVGLDFANGQDGPGNLPITHVVAKIPLPADIEPDATMSNWPKGRAGVIDAVEKNLKALPLDGVTRDVNGVVRDLAVSSGPFSLGAVRATYATQISANIHVLNRPFGVAGEPSQDEIRDAVREAIVSKGHVAQGDVTITSSGATPNSQFAVSFPVQSSGTAQDTEAEWFATLATVATEAKRAIRALPGAALGPTYDVTVGAPVSSKGAQTIDLDFIIHGVDYSDLTGPKKSAFLRALAAQVRSGLNYPAPGGSAVYGCGAAPSLCADVNGVLDQIRVVFYPEETKGSVRTSVSIPAPPTTSRVLYLVTRLNKDMDTLLKDHMQAQLRLVTGVDFLSTWTKENIRVIMPGHTI